MVRHTVLSVYVLGTLLAYAQVSPLDLCSAVDADTCVSTSTDGGGVSVGVEQEEVVDGGDGGYDAGGGDDYGGGDSGGGWDDSWAESDEDDGSNAAAAPQASGGRPGKAFGRPLDQIERLGGPAAGPSAPRLPTRVRSSQLQNYAPSTASFTIEPNGWSIVGANTNAYTTASTVTKPATINNVPVTVTFTPNSYTWDWGDGTVTTTTDPGASWQQLGAPDWAQTETSHRYSQRGDYTITLTVTYTATVTANGRTIPVDGTVTGPGTRATIKIVESKRALINDECITQPDREGCP